MIQRKAEQIAESFINGNISWVRKELNGKSRMTAAVAQVIKEYYPNELDSFLRIILNK